MARVLVAGGAGFLGSHLADAHIGRGDEVVVVDNFSSGREENLAHLRTEPLLTVIAGDIIDPLPSTAPFDLIYNMASLASPPRYLEFPIETLRVGSEGTRLLLERAHRDEARFVQASTSEIYGDPLEHPQREEYWGNVNPIGPRSVYDEAKRFGEALTMAMHRAQGVKVGIARIFNTYGPRLHPLDGRVLSNFINQALRHEPITVYGDGSQTRSLCYVSDMVDAFLRLGDSSLTGPYNFGGTEEVSMLHLAEIVKEVTASSSPIIFAALPVDDPTRRRPDTSRALADLQWQPKVTMREGIGSLVRYYAEAH